MFQKTLPQRELGYLLRLKEKQQRKVNMEEFFLFPKLDVEGRLILWELERCIMRMEAGKKSNPALCIRRAEQYQSKKVG